MPYAYQCCVYGSCASYKSAGQWEAEHSDTDEDLHKRTVAMYPIHTDAHCKKTSDLCKKVKRAQISLFVKVQRHYNKENLS